MKTLIGLIVAVGLIALVLFSLSTNGIGPDGAVLSPHATYFQEVLTQGVVADVGQPIEGFEPAMLIAAYPGLIQEDFDGVRANEGEYVFAQNELVFTKDDGELHTSAARALTARGYDMLLSRVSSRLSVPIEATEDIDALLFLIDTREERIVAFGEEVVIFGVPVSIRELLEDSRCPSGVTCIQAGTVRISILVGGSQYEVALHESMQTNIGSVTLADVFPIAHSDAEPQVNDYAFTLEFVK